MRLTFEDNMMIADTKTARKRAVFVSGVLPVSG
jgi:hypothetical protein